MFDYDRELLTCKFGGSKVVCGWAWVHWLTSWVIWVVAMSVIILWWLYSSFAWFMRMGTLAEGRTKKRKFSLAPPSQIFSSNCDRLIRALPHIWVIVTDQSELFPQIWVNPVSDIFSALQCNNIYARGRANLLFPARSKPQKWVYLANTFLAPGPRGVAALVPVSEDKSKLQYWYWGEVPCLMRTNLPQCFAILLVSKNMRLSVQR